MRTRVGFRLLAFGAMAVLLAGCFKVNMDIEVATDNTVSGSAIIAVDKQLVALSGQNVDQLFSDMDTSTLPPGATVAPYDDGDFVGQEVTFDTIPLSEFSGASDPLTGTSDQLSITREGNEFHVSGNLDMSGQDFTGGGQIPQQVLDSFEFVISITFPGEVKTATGEIDGNTVTWEPKFGENNRIEAVASAIPSGGSALLWILIVAAVIVVIVIALLIARSRRPVPPAVPVDEGATTPDAGVTSSTTTSTSTEPEPGVHPMPPAEPAPHTPEAPGSAPPPEEEEETPPPVPPVSS